MKIVGIIAEYNPFHNGHEYQIQKAKEVTGSDTAIIVMSGDYVQRGLPAIMPKRLRAEMALSCGANAIFELPVCFSTGSAELFAESAVALLDHLGVVDTLCFGSECGNLSELEAIADVLVEEPEAYQKALRQNLKEGVNFPQARSLALSSLPGLESSIELMKAPNNILGIEYLKALKKRGSSITPYTIPRMDSDHHDMALSHTYSSASAIRSCLTDISHCPGDVDAFLPLERQIPKVCLSRLKEEMNLSYPIEADDFSLLLKDRLMGKNPEELVDYADVSRELSNRVCARLNDYLSYEQFSQLLKTKELTQSRINRALLHILLGIKKQHIEEYAALDYHFYARLLGFSEKNEDLISHIASHCDLPLIARLSDRELLSDTGRRMLDQNMVSSNLYASVVTDKYQIAFKNESQQPILKI